MVTSCSFVMFGVGVALLTDWVGLFSDLGVMVAAWLWLFGIVLHFVGKAITAFNRSKFLAPLPYRDESG